MSRFAHAEDLRYLLCVPDGRPLAIENSAFVERVTRSTGSGSRQRRTKENASLTCRYAEPPIGIEPMTYALRGA